MSEVAREGTVRPVRVELEPFSEPTAADYYANMVGVGFTQDDLVLLFGQVLPLASVSGDNSIKVAPRLRVTLSARAAADLAKKIHEMLDKRRSMMGSIALEGASDEQ
jgi:hypothetical protein